MDLEKSPLKDHTSLPREEDLERYRERHDQQHGPEEAQESEGRDTAQRHKGRERRGDEEEASRRVDEEQPDDEHGRGHDLGPRVEIVNRRGDGVELAETVHPRALSAASVSSKRTGTPMPGFDSLRREATRTVAGASAGSP